MIRVTVLVLATAAGLAMSSTEASAQLFAPPGTTYPVPVGGVMPASATTPTVYPVINPPYVTSYSYGYAPTVYSPYVYTAPVYRTGYYGGYYRPGWGVGYRSYGYGVRGFRRW
jgi:hypothetical protein